MKRVIGHFLYTFWATIESPTGVETRIGSGIISGLISKFTAVKGVTYEKLDPGSNKAYISN